MSEHDAVTAPGPEVCPSDSWDGDGADPLGLSSGAAEDDPAFALLLQQTRNAVQKQVHGIEPAEAGAQVFLGRYRVESLAGKGGMGTVLAAEDVWLERKVALKIVNTFGARERRRLVREGVALAKLSHPNVVQVHDVELGERGEHAYVVMEYVEGTTLARWQVAEPRSVQEILNEYRQAAQGLWAAHQVGIVHRDFKPDNVLVDAAGVVKVADFGLASAGETEGDGGNASGRTERAVTAPQPVTSVVIETGLGLTPGYCAPEQLRGERPTDRADQFSFCAALYEALTGVLPFGSSRVPEVYEREVAAGIVARAEAVRISRRVVRMLARGLAMRPEDRFEDMTAILATLEPRASRWPWVAAGLAPVAALLTAMLMPEPEVVEVEVDPCVVADDALPLERVPGDWASGAESGAKAFVGERAVAHRASWKDASEDLCRAGRRGELAGSEQAQAQQCLDTTAREFNLVLRLVTTDGSITDPFAAFDDLHAPALCVLGGGRPAFDAADPELQREFDEVRALQLEGRNEDALSRARSLHERAKVAGDTVILAQVSFLMGKLESLMGDDESALRDLAEASVHAEALGDDILAIDAIAELVDEAATSSLDPSDGVRWQQLGEAKLLRSGAGSSEVAGQYHSAVANLAYRQGDFESALEHGEQAHALLAETLGEDGLATLAARTNHAVALVAAGRPQEAIVEYERILEVRRRRYGARHSTTITDELGLAYAHMIAGQRAQALAGFERVEALATPATTKALEQLGVSAVVRQCEVIVGDKDYPRAGPVCERALSMMPRVASDDRASIAQQAILYGSQGLVLVSREELEPALALLDRQRELLLAMHPENAAMLATNATTRCYVLDALGRVRECAQSLPRARRWYEATSRSSELTTLCEELGLDPPNPRGAER